jgi:glycerol-1-phosphate dehydrogenase [NAD(P)+]
VKINVDQFEINDYLGQDFDCVCGKNHTIPLELVKIKDHVEEDVLQFLKTHNYQTIYMIEDENTQRVCGNALEEYLINHGIVCDHVVLQDPVVPDETAVFNIILNMKQPYDYIIGVGSGTLNDLSKFVSKRVGLNYAIVATVASMDGFASVGAALITNDLKTTYDSHVPTAIFGDLDVLANAPMDMTVAGLEDIIGKYNCLIDWKIAHIVTGVYYCQTIVDMVRKSINECVENAQGVLNRDKKAIKAVMEALVETGMAMGFVGNSRPASGSEHHLSHYWEMKFLFAHKPAVWHGVKVGLATPGVIAMWKRLVNGDIDFDQARETVKQFDYNQWEALVKDRFEGAADGVIALEKKAGKNNIEAGLQRIDVIESKWNEIKKVINEEMPSAEYVTDLLKSVNSPYRPEQVGIDEQLTHDAVILAKEVRVRYGLLQMLWDLGKQEEYANYLVEYYKEN